MTHQSVLLRNKFALVIEFRYIFGMPIERHIPVKYIIHRSSSIVVMIYLRKIF